jgi:alcohol dehydrogenase, propanol-preferring
MVQLPESMLAAQVVEFNHPYKIHQVPTPGKDLDQYDMLVKVAVGSLCHTDGMVSEGLMGTILPCIASHEGAGTVVKVGSAITEFTPGDRILISLAYHRCRECADCKGPEEDSQYCRKAQYCGVTRDGSFAEYELVDGRECCKLPDNLSFQSAAPLACAGTTVCTSRPNEKGGAGPTLNIKYTNFYLGGGLVRAGLKSGESVAIVGGGGGLGQ